MSDLTLGGNGLDWGAPAPVYMDGRYQTGGLIWLGTRAATEADKQAARDYYKRQNILFDEGTLVGTYHWAWNDFAWRHGAAKKLGGIGSEVYEMQKVGQGVQFTSNAIWYTNSDNKLVKGIPPQAGAYHYVDVGGGYRDAHEGPEPGSPADVYRGSGEFYWDEDQYLYDVR